ncbi:MAG: D-sedoheptulose-7-phosphate isomerase [Candidatus Aminicenantales bacterium]
MRGNKEKKKKAEEAARDAAIFKNFRKYSRELEKLLELTLRENGSNIIRLVDATRGTLRQGRKILIFGNGGSAAEAQHFAAELVNKFLKVRPALKAIALSTDTSILTSVANDSSFDLVFSRQIEALGEEGDMAIALSTSGRSANIIEALKMAKQRGLITVAITGEGGTVLGQITDYLLAIPSSSTPRIQEVHLFLLHLLAEELERALPAS